MPTPTPSPPVSFRRYIPSNQRVLYINSIQIGYNCFLSIISNRDSTAAAPGEAKPKAVGAPKKK